MNFLDVFLAFVGGILGTLAVVALICWPAAALLGLPFLKTWVIASAAVFLFRIANN